MNNIFMNNKNHEQNKKNNIWTIYKMKQKKEHYMNNKNHEQNKNHKNNKSNQRQEKQ